MTEVRPLALVRRKSGGADRDRTGGLLVANQALSQLSYSPGSVVVTRVVGLSGFEPLTSRLSGVRSSQLSYRPVVNHNGRRPVFRALLRIADKEPKPPAEAGDRGSLKTRQDAIIVR